MLKPVIIIAGTPTWIDTLRQTLAADYHVVHQPSAVGYIQTLIDTLAAMVFIDGDMPAWEAWVHAPKVSPATRRIPIVLLSDDVQAQQRALIEGADLSASVVQGLADALNWVRDHARLPDAALLESLACDCQQALPAQAAEGIAHFNRGEYYRQHDLLEAQWVETAGPVRNLYRAILQVGVAYYQIERGNYRGALKMFQRSVQWLMALPDACQGVDVAQLRTDSQAAYAELVRLGPARIHEFDRSYFRNVQFTQ